MPTPSACAFLYTYLRTSNQLTRIRVEVNVGPIRVVHISEYGGSRDHGRAGVHLGDHPGGAAGLHGVVPGDVAVRWRRRDDVPEISVGC